MTTMMMMIEQKKRVHERHERTRKKTSSAEPSPLISCLSCLSWTLFLFSSSLWRAPRVQGAARASRAGAARGGARGANRMRSRKQGSGARFMLIAAALGGLVALVAYLPGRSADAQQIHRNGFAKEPV